MPQCFGEEGEVLVYRVLNIVNHRLWKYLYELPGMVYSFYLLLIDDCKIGEIIYDLYSFCK